MGRVSDCINSADVLGVECVGGICGTINDHSIKTSYNIGKVLGEKYVGAILGRAVTGDVINSYYLTGCASDSSGKLQNGVGASNTGSSRSDKKGSTTALKIKARKSIYLI